MGLTELKFDLTSWKYCASKLTITSQNYPTNMSFAILKIKERSLLSFDIMFKS